MSWQLLSDSTSSPPPVVTLSLSMPALAANRTRALVEGWPGSVFSLVQDRKALKSDGARVYKILAKPAQQWET